MKIAVVGAGYWGSKIVSTIEKIGHECLAVDIKQGSTIDDIDCNMAVVATPAHTHFDIADKLLAKGCHVLIEKPVAHTTNQINKLCDTADKQNLILMAGHVLCYTDLIKRLQNVTQKQNVLHIESRRLAWGKMHEDISPILNFAPHDVSVLDFILKGAMPNTVSAKGYRFDSRPQPDYVVCDLDYGDFVAQLQLGWYYPTKIRTITTTTDQGQYVWDDVESSWKFFANQMSGKYQTSNIDMAQHYIDPKIKSPVQNYIEHFINCVEQGKEPITGKEHAKRVTKVVQMLEESLNV